MGRNIQIQSMSSLPRMSVCFLDAVGPMKAFISRGRSQKVFFLITTCVATRFSVITLLENMTSNGILMGLRTAFLQTGSEFGCLLFSDSGTNILPLMKLNNEDQSGNERNDSEIIDDLRKTLHKNNVILKANTPSSSWRAGLVESVVGLYKMALKRSGLMDKSHTLQQWQYIAMSCQKQINDRPLNLNYINDSFEICTPNFLMYGRDKMSLQQKIDLENIPRSGEKLFARLAELDANLKKFQDIYWNSYILECVKWLKWRNQGRKLKLDDCVYILDKKNDETNQNHLAIVKKIKSDRTYTVEFIQKSMKIDPVTFEVTKTAKKSTLDRPAQKLALITAKEECQDFSVEPRGVPELLDNIEDDPIFINDEINVEEINEENGENDHTEEFEIINPAIVSDEFLEEDHDDLEDNQINKVHLNVDNGEKIETEIGEVQENIPNEETTDDVNKNNDRNTVADKNIESNDSLRIQPSRKVKKTTPIITIQDDVESIHDLSKPKKQKGRKRKRKY